MQRHLAEERDAETFRLVPCAAMTENIGPRAAVRAEEIAHVLHHPEHRHVHPFEHGHAAPGVDQRKILRRGDADRASERHLLREVEWGTLDVMVVDMPPGTGDAQLTMAQQVPLRGAVIVSTPQDLALIDARRGVSMFKRVDVPVLGVVENMSYFLCPHCGTRSDIFGHGGARHEAERLGVPFLGEVPLHMAIREKSDAGLPVVATEPDSPHAQIYRDIAAKVREQLKGVSAGRAAPKIVIEA